eukprot:scaffold4518_cov410-Prasinococcus_capsulatus_cf.AAC.19
MTEQQLQGVMRRVGVERFDPQPGDEFDPNIHSALFEVPAQSVGDGAKAGSIGVVTKVISESRSCAAQLPQTLQRSCSVCAAPSVINSTCAPGRIQDA